MGEIKAPTFAILGERDLPDFHVVADRFAREISDARKVVLPVVGHMANMDDPAGFNQIVLDFLDNVTKSATAR